MKLNLIRRYFCFLGLHPRNILYTHGTELFQIVAYGKCEYCNRLEVFDGMQWEESPYDEDELNAMANHGELERI